MIVDLDAVSQEIAETIAARVGGVNLTTDEYDYIVNIVNGLAIVGAIPRKLGKKWIKLNAKEHLDTYKKNMKMPKQPIAVFQHKDINILRGLDKDRLATYALSEFGLDTGNTECRVGRIDSFVIVTRTYADMEKLIKEMK